MQVHLVSKCWKYQQNMRKSQMRSWNIKFVILSYVYDILSTRMCDTEEAQRCYNIDCINESVAFLRTQDIFLSCITRKLLWNFVT